MTGKSTKGLTLRTYLGLTVLATPLARWHLNRRLARGKEDPDRVREKQGVASCPRPEGPLVWLHAVGVGEVLALPALASALRTECPDVTPLITSSSRTSGKALAANLPEGVIHQYLPLDIRAWRRRFLDHWRPSLSVWAERDIWPGFIVDCHERDIPLALVNARMDDASFQAKSRLKNLFHDLYSRFTLVEAQDAETARHLSVLGARAPQITGSLKTAAPPLADQPDARSKLETLFKAHPLWLAASTHPEEEPLIAKAHRLVLDQNPNSILIIAPRDPARAQDTQAILLAQGISAEILPDTNIPPQSAQAYVVAQIGQLGLWYRMAPISFVGGSLDTTGGHNPWEPARLNSAILHGPNVANFSTDYTALHAKDAALHVKDAESLAQAVTSPKTLELRARATSLAQENMALPKEMARRLLTLIETS